MQKPSRTVKSYDEVSMDLFVPPGGKTKNWYVRVYVPSDLRDVYGKVAEFKQSTKTSDKVLAQARASVFVRQKAEEFLQARVAKAADETCRTAKPVVLDANLIEHITSIRLANLVRFDDEMRDGLAADEDWDEHDAFISHRLQELSQIIARRKSSAAYKPFVEQSLEEAHQYNYEVSVDDPLFDEFIKSMAKAEKRAIDLMHHRNQGKSDESGDEMLGPWLSDLLKGWLAESVAHLDARTIGTYTSRIEHFVKFVHDKPVSQVQQKDVYDWLQQLLTVDKLSRKTLTDGYLPALRGAMQYGLVSGKYNMSMDPTQGVRVPKLTRAENKKRSAERLPFPLSYVDMIFSSYWYEGDRARKGMLSKVFVGGGARYWVPLLAVMHGFRPEEISQMTLLDVGFQDGVFAIQVTDEDEGQHTKNESSKRWVPVHSTLLSLGFEGYVNEQRALQKIPEPPDSYAKRVPGEVVRKHARAGRLFPELDTTYGRQANAFGQAFNRFIRNKLKFEKEYVFYSFRHLWEDRRREAMALAANEGRSWPPGLHFQLSGRSSTAREKDEGSAFHYGTGYPPSVMKPYCDQINLQSVKLPVPWREFKKR